MRAVVVFVLILALAIGAAYFMISDNRKLKIYNPAEINPKLVDESKRNVFSNHKIGQFRLLSQSGDTITEADTEGKIYVADFFFTTCPSICKDMSKQLMRVQETFGDRQDFLILSHTVQPEVDSVPVLASYAERHQADPKKWLFLTGNKKHIYDLARRSYFAVLTEGKGDSTDFIHTENFVLIDKDRRIRGFYDGTSEEDVDRLIEEVNILYQEYEE